MHAINFAELRLGLNRSGYRNWTVTRSRTSPGAAIIYDAAGECQYVVHPCNNPPRRGQWLAWNDIHHHAYGRTPFEALQTALQNDPQTPPQRNKNQENPECSNSSSPPSPSYSQQTEP